MGRTSNRLYERGQYQATNADAVSSKFGVQMASEGRTEHISDKRSERSVEVVFE